MLEPGFLESCATAIGGDDRAVLAYTAARQVDGDGNPLGDIPRFSHVVSADPVERFREVVRHETAQSPDIRADQGRLPFGRRLCQAPTTPAPVSSLRSWRCGARSPSCPTEHFIHRNHPAGSLRGLQLGPCAPQLVRHRPRRGDLHAPVGVHGRADGRCDPCARCHGGSGSVATERPSGGRSRNGAAWRWTWQRRVDNFWFCGVGSSPHRRMSRISFVFPHWKLRRRVFAMDVLGHDLARSVASEHEVVMYVQAAGRSYRAVEEGGITYQPTFSGLDQRMRPPGRTAVADGAFGATGHIDALGLLRVCRRRGRTPATTATRPGAHPYLRPIPSPPPTGGTQRSLGAAHARPLPSAQGPRGG